MNIPLRASFRRALLILGLLVAGAALAAGGDKATGAPKTAGTKDYDYYLTGSAADVGVASPTTQMLVLMGGGTDVDAAFQAMIARARQNAGGASIDIVVIRTSGADGYNPYLLAMGGVDSVESLVIKTREGANDPRVNAIVAGADLLFIAGGDQSTYVDLWTGTALDATLRALRPRRVPIGGTSAGLAILGDVDYTGANGSVTSERALGNPYDKRVTLDTRFITGLPGLEGAITDAHLVTRDRMGRLVTFLARMIGDDLSPLGTARAIGVDEATAVVVDGSTAQVLGASAAYFVKPAQPAVTLQPKQPLTLRGVHVDRLQQGGIFDLSTWWPATMAASYVLNVESGVLTSDQAGGSAY